MAAAVGSACAFFLWSLDAVTAFRFDHPWLLYLLPVAGFGCAWIYGVWGGRAERGNNLLLDEIHEPGGGVPRRMAPLVLLGTLITHLFGGSAGREGTAVQMGGSLASAFGQVWRLPTPELRLLLMAGVAAGFGAVFGTPLAGTIFALEVLTIGRLQYDALLTCLAAALCADWVCRAWGIEHTAYSIQYLAGSHGPPALLHWQWPLLAKAALAAVAFGWAAWLFARLTHGWAALLRKALAFAPWRPVVGGLAVIALFHLSGSGDFLGLGVWSREPGALTIPSFLDAGAEVHPWTWLWKLLFTAATVGAGFKGGEVTPLFFIGAALGQTLGWLLSAPPDLFAALGFVAIFAGATNTPLACTLMGIELFGATHAVYFAAVCFVSYLASGKTGIYTAQRPGSGKFSAFS